VSGTQWNRRHGGDRLGFSANGKKWVAVSPDRTNSPCGKTQRINPHPLPGNFVDIVEIENYHNIEQCSVDNGFEYTSCLERQIPRLRLEICGPLSRPIIGRSIDVLDVTKYRVLIANVAAGFDLQRE